MESRIYRRPFKIGGSLISTRIRMVSSLSYAARHIFLTSAVPTVTPKEKTQGEMNDNEYLRTHTTACITSTRR